VILYTDHLTGPRRLERELGVLLLDRSSRHVRLTAAGERLLPEARAVLAAAGRVRQVAADVAAGAGGILRVGTSQGLGERLDRTLEELRKTAPGLQVRLISAPAAERIAQVRSGELDAAFVRAVTAAPGIELLPTWQDPLTIALPATHPLAAPANHPASTTQRHSAAPRAPTAQSAVPRPDPGRVRRCRFRAAVRAAVHHPARHPR
jgi:DNA-binding transcriptional LysR family regulator